MATSLLKWYLAHELGVTDVYQVIGYHPEVCFKVFGDKVYKAHVDWLNGRRRIYSSFWKTLAENITCTQQDFSTIFTVRNQAQRDHVDTGRSTKHVWQAVV